MLKNFILLNDFLRIPHIIIPHKLMLFSAVVIVQVSYYAPLLGSYQERRGNTQTLVNTGLYLKDFPIRVALHPFIVFLKIITFLIYQRNV